MILTLDSANSKMAFNHQWHLLVQLHLHLEYVFKRQIWSLKSEIPM